MTAINWKRRAERAESRYEHLRQEVQAKGLAKLTPTHIVDGREQKCWKEPPGPNRWKERSRTYPGIAQAMAMQYGTDFEMYHAA